MKGEAKVQRRYKRYFVILEEVDKGFSTARSEGVKGYAKIEVRNDKGILSLYCQSLRPLEEKKESYRLYLISTKENTGAIAMDIGPISADNSGRGEIIWTFNAENVKASKRRLEDFDTIVLTVETLDESQRIVVPLVGYIHKEKTNWKPILQEELYISNKGREEKTFRNYIEENPTTELEIEETVDIDEEKYELEQDNKVQEAPKVPMDLVNEDVNADVEVEAIQEEETIQNPEIILEEEIVQEAETMEDVQESEEIILSEEVIKDKEYIPQYNLQEGWDGDDIALQQYIEATLKIFPRVEIFDSNLRNYQWWQIPYNDDTIYRSYMPFISHIEILHNPYYYHYPQSYSSECQGQISVYQHHIFGIAYDENRKAKYYVYGIPGKKTLEDQPYEGKTGFTYWHPYNYIGGSSQEDFGYWLLHIDANTKGIVEPLMETEI